MIEVWITIVLLVVTFATREPEWAMAAGLFAIATNLNGIYTTIKGG